MSHPLVVHCCVDKTFDVYVGRRHKRFPNEDGFWGNPIPLLKEEDRDKVLDQYTNWLYSQQHILDRIHELKGKKLGCWWAPRRCHADILAELANSI